MANVLISSMPTSAMLHMRRRCMAHLSTLVALFPHGSALNITVQGYAGSLSSASPYAAERTPARARPVSSSRR